MNVLGVIDSLYGAVNRVKDGIRQGVVTAVILLCGAALVLCALGFAVAAGYLWLATQLPAHWAALCVAGGLLLVGGLVIAIGAVRGRRRPVRESPALSAATYDDITRQAEAAADRAVREALSSVRDHPSAAVLSALALGVVVGLLRPKDDR